MEQKPGMIVNSVPSSMALRIHERSASPAHSVRGSLPFIVKKAELETVCGIKSTFPVHEIPEFAFAGKSNVGKSSLINALLQRKALARTSASPGKTQTINFYNLNDACYLVDLPGYGYTKIAESVKADWGRMVERYLKQSRSLRRIFLLVDIRHKPSADDRMMYDWILSKGFKPVVIATKADKLGKNDTPKSLRLIRETLDLKGNDILIPFSSESKSGREDIYQLLEEDL